MKPLYYLREQRGVSYIQILMASSMIAGLAVVGLRMMEQQERLARITSQKFEITYLVNEIKYLLSNPDNCKASFEGVNPFRSQRKINALKKELRKGAGVEASFYLKYFTFGSSKKLYGQENIKILEYQLSDNYAGVDANKGSTNLIIKMMQDKGEEVIESLVPLQISMDDDRIEGCELYMRGESSFNNIKNQKVFLGKELHVGKVAQNATVSSAGGVRIQPLKGEIPLCNFKTAGGIIYSKKEDVFFFCSSFNKWVSLGELVINEKAKRYRVDSLRSGSSSIETEVHKLCILKEVTSNLRGSCRLTRENAIGLVKWKITAEFSSAGGGQLCEAECFN